MDHFKIQVNIPIAVLEQKLRNDPGSMELLCQCWDHIIYLGSCWVLGYKYGPNPGTVKGNHCCL